MSINNKVSKTFKKLLITTAISSIAFSSNDALAINRTSVNLESRTNVNADWNPVGPVASGDTLFFGGAHTIYNNPGNGVSRFNTNGQTGNLVISREGAGSFSINSITGTGSKATVILRGTGNRPIYNVQTTDISQMGTVEYEVNSRFFLNANNIKTAAAFVSGFRVGELGTRPGITGVEFSGNFDNFHPSFFTLESNSEVILSTSKLVTRAIVAHSGSILTINTDVFIDVDLNLHTGGTVIVNDGKNITANSRVVNLNDGKLRFLNSGSLTTGFITIKDVEIGSGQVTIDTNNYSPINTSFTAAGGTILLNNTGDTTFNTTVKSTTGATNGTIIVDSPSKTVTFQGTFSNNANELVKDLVVKSGSKATFTTDLNLSGKLDLSDGGTVSVNSGINLNVPTLALSTASTGTLDFKGNANVNFNIGDPTTIGTVGVSNGNVDFSGTIFKTTNTNLTNVNAILTFSKNAPVSVNSNFRSNSNGNIGKLVIDNSNTVTIGGSFSNTANDQISEILVKAGSKLILNTELNLSGKETSKNNFNI
ncbi:MAG: hypothetical protein HRU35_06280 [Rickettsiaceae bacterium]|nr:hypothetical protein [Rickettsiaceae bacterium]